MRDNGGEWMLCKRNPPSASSMGRVWEKQIRSARTILTFLLKSHSSNSLNDESLRTLLIEVEAVVDSRPWTSDFNSVVPLSPITLLTPCCFPLPFLQHISNEFGIRWRNEVLAQLQCRPKCNTIRRNCKVGEIVLLWKQQQNETVGQWQK